MTWTLLVGLVVVLGLTLIARRSDLARMGRQVEERDKAVRSGADAALLQHPVVDLTRCLGCGTCVAACPEEGVLELVHGQAMVVRGARCLGHSACERECPVGAITVTIANIEEREDVPALTDQLEAVGTPGLFLAGEVTAHTLVKTATDHGAAVGTEVGRRIQLEGIEGARRDSDDVLDLVIVGAGPAGIACALAAKEQGLRFVTIDQEQELGGTVAKYPRRRLVMTEPIELPLYGRLRRKSYSKEELIEEWQRIAIEQELPIRGGEIFQGVETDEDGRFLVSTQNGIYVSSYVCLALGRRGTPNKLGVSGEDLPKVAYSLLDANSYQGRKILVVGGGDSAVETAMGLAEQPGNEVTLSYRREDFFRIRSKNAARLERCLYEGRLQVFLQSQVTAIHHDHVELSVRSPETSLNRPSTQPDAYEAGYGAQVQVVPQTGTATVVLPNDEVFVMAGGTAPFEVLERSGVSFDPELRTTPAPVIEQGTGLIRALVIGFALAVATLVWALWHYDYYSLAPVVRPEHTKHNVLRPGRGIGLWLGITSVVLIAANLFYLVRRAARFKFQWGSLQHWMTSHVATGILAFLCATLHAAMSVDHSVGGRAYLAMAVLLVTGAIGRYFYAYVPRAANGRELALEEIKAHLGRYSEEWDQGQQRFREHARVEVEAMIAKRQWRGSFFGRVLALIGLQRDLRHLVKSLEAEGRKEGIAEDQIQETIELARNAHSIALVTSHYEDLRAVLNSWRYLHRWVAALLVLLVVIHIAYAWIYGAFWGVD